MHEDPTEDHELVRVLDDDGAVVEGATVPALSDDDLLGMYEEMRTLRHFDDRAVKLNRQGRLGTYTPIRGQEAAQIASAHALAAQDWLVPSFREHGAKMVRGLGLEYTLMYWGGYEEGTAIPAGVNVYFEEIPVGGQVPHAMGMAYSAALDPEDERVFLCYLGDGATSTGDFHEGLNFAAVFDTPNVFFCNNNQYAVSLPFERQTAAETIAAKGPGYGMRSVRVDGMDPLATYAVTEAAVETARNPAEGEPRPTFVEAVQYRLAAHTTADDPTVYRDDEEVERWRRKDPVRRFGAFLRDRGLLDDETDDAIRARAEAHVAEVVERYESFEADHEAMFRHLFEAMPPEVEAQLDELHRLADEYGADAVVFDG